MVYHASLLDTEGNTVGVVAIRTLDTKIKDNWDHKIANQPLDVKRQNPVTSLNKMLQLAIENTDEGFDAISSKEYWQFWS